MCGIAGVLRRDLWNPSSDLAGGRGLEAARDGQTAAAHRMAATLSHRGPDGAAVWVSPGCACALAHTRLKVIDLHTGDQPLENEDGSVQVVFNGEIYNFRELRQELEARGHQFRTRSDTEVLVHGWEEWGEALPSRLDGMFAFGLWDEGQGCLFLARDRAGKKPLFLYQDKERVAFASELKAVLALPGADDTLDPGAVPLYLTYGYVPTPGTFYRQIRKLPPASFLRMDPGDGEGSSGGTVLSDSGTHRYWRLDWAPRPPPPGGAASELRGLLTRAVEKRLVSDVPLGAFLSGGLDSTIVVGLMSRLMDEPVRTFSIGMADDPVYDETPFARLAADRFGTEHTAFTLQAQEVSLLDELLDAYDEPFGDSSALPTYIVSRLTKGEVTVALTGDGSDELFAGYLRFRGMMIANGLPRWLVGAGNALARWLPHRPSHCSPTRRFARFFAAAALSDEERMLRWIGFFPDGHQELFRPEVGDLLSRDEVVASFRGPLQRNAHVSTLARTLALNFETYLLDDLLVKSDRNSMAHGLELRSPFLDSAVMAFAAGLRDRHRVRGRYQKVILREAFGDLIPPAILQRGKMGFGIPLPTWFRSHWRPLVEERVLGNDARLWDWVRPEPIQRLVKEHMAGDADHGHQIWALLTLESWLRRGRYSLPS